MKTRAHRRWPWFVLALLIALAALVWWFPASWAWSWTRGNYPAVHVRSVHGSVWHGRADGLSVAGQRFGRLRWTLSRAALFGHARVHLDLRGAGVIANGHIARADDGAIVVRKFHFRVPMTRLPMLWPQGTTLDGTLVGHVSRLRLAHAWPEKLRARVTWKHAQVKTKNDHVTLGNLESRWRTPGGGVIRADLASVGNGPVRLRGHFTATTLGWRLHATARAHGGRPRLQRWLQGFGRPQSDGGVLIQRHSGLMMAGENP